MKRCKFCNPCDHCWAIIEKANRSKTNRQLAAKRTNTSQTSQKRSLAAKKSWQERKLIKSQK